jgi:hypothetical protein
MVELGDLVATLLDVYHNLEGKSGEVSSLPQLLEERWNHISVKTLLERKGEPLKLPLKSCNTSHTLELFFSLTLSIPSYVDRHEPFVPIKETATIQDAINAMARTGRRVPVVNAEDKLVQIVSPFSVVNFFAHHVSWSATTTSIFFYFSF